MTKKSSATLQQVKLFWETNPLFSGEGVDVGSRAWFEQLEQVVYEDCFAGHGPEPIFTMGLTPESDILEAGCGPGFWVRHFLRYGCRNITAFDLTERAVKLAQESLETFGLESNTTFLVANAEQVPFEDSCFDHVNCHGVIHHTPSPEACLQEFIRVLRPGGSLCFAVYYRTIYLRQPWMTKIISALLHKVVRMPGRGREDMLKSGDPNEIVRIYDGADNPLGVAFTLDEIREMLPANCRITDTRRQHFPVRALPFGIPRGLHRWLHNTMGLLLVVRVVKD